MQLDDILNENRIMQINYFIDIKKLSLNLELLLNNHQSVQLEFPNRFIETGK